MRSTNNKQRINKEGGYFILYEYAIRLEMKDALVDCHEFYRFPLPPLCSTSPPYFRTRVFRGFRDFWGLKKKKKKSADGFTGHFNTTKSAVCFS